MNEQDLFRATEGASDAQLLASEKHPKHAHRRLVACIAVLVLICTSVAIITRHKGMAHDETIAAITALDFNGAFYEACDRPDVLVRYGLPKKITSDMAGEHLAYLQSDGSAGYEGTTSVTDIELYTYAPSPCRGVYVLRDGDTYMAALFCNFYQFDDNTHVEFAEVFRTYGVESAQDIASVAEVRFRGDPIAQVIGHVVSDPAAIEDFWQIATALCAYGNADFQAQVFDGTPEELQADLHQAYANDRRKLQIETTDGLRFYISVHPTFGWMDAALSYYKMDAAMSSWFAKHFG